MSTIHTLVYLMSNNPRGNNEAFVSRTCVVCLLLSLITANSSSQKRMVSITTWTIRKVFRPFRLVVDPKKSPLFLDYCFLTNSALLSHSKEAFTTNYSHTLRSNANLPLSHVTYDRTNRNKLA